LLAGVVLRLLPLDKGGRDQPPVSLLAWLALVIAVITCAAVFVVVRFQLRLPASIALLAVVFNALVVGVKYVAGPHAVFEANRKTEFEANVSLNDSVGALLTAVMVFALYALVLVLIFRWARRRAGLPARIKGRASKRPETIVAGIFAFLAFAVAALIMVVGLLVLGSETGLAYLGYVFSSAAALVVAAVLAVAVTVAMTAFASTAARAKALGDASSLVALFVVAMAFLALYHVLWVVYILVLTSVWPLKVVTPK